MPTVTTRRSYVPKRPLGLPGTVPLHTTVSTKARTVCGAAWTARIFLLTCQRFAMQGGILPCLVRETLSCRDCRGRASPAKAIMSRATGPVAIHRRRSSPGRLDRQRHPAFSVATQHSGDQIGDLTASLAPYRGQMLPRFHQALLGKTLTGRQNPAGLLGLCLGHRARTTLMKCRLHLHGARGMRVTRAVMGRDDVLTRLGPATGTLRRFPRQGRQALVAVARAVWPKDGLDQTQVSLLGILRHLHS